MRCSRSKERLCPRYFSSLFEDDLELYFQDSISSGLNIDDITLIMSLFTDDKAILYTSPEEIFKQYILHCSAWGPKTKISIGL